MWWIFILLSHHVVGEFSGDPEDQLVMFKEKNKNPIGTMTTSAGAPINSIDAQVTLNRRLIANEYFMDTMSHFVRERIPERVVHAKGAGAFGYFQVTHDITDICKADVFSNVGKETPVAVRFSTVFPERGGADTVRDARGFAIKFYTQEGNFDIAGLNMPVFAIKDPLFFPSFVRVQKKNPATGLLDGNMLWDFITLHPESLHVFMIIFSDRGTPKGYRHMPGFSIHTYQVVNKNGESSFLRFHLLPKEGIENFSSEEAQKIAGEDLDYATRDLNRAIGNGDYPEWTIYVQALSENDVKTAGFNVFDITMTLPEDKYPLRPVGRMILNRNPVNFHAEVEQLAYCPGNLVPGILGGPDQMFIARRFAYRDTELYRLGANFNKIHVNCPFKALTYNRDGVPPVVDNQGGMPVYYPNSFNGPVEYIEQNRTELISITESGAVNNFNQLRELYKNEFTQEQRSRVAENILASLILAEKFLQDKAVKLLKNIDLNLGLWIERRLKCKH